MIQPINGSGATPEPAWGHARSPQSSSPKRIQEKRPLPLRNWDGRAHHSVRSNPCGRPPLHERRAEDCPPYPVPAGHPPICIKIKHFWTLEAKPPIFLTRNQSFLTSNWSFLIRNRAFLMRKSRRRVPCVLKLDMPAGQKRGNRKQARRRTDRKDFGRSPAPGQKFIASG